MRVLIILAEEQVDGGHVHDAKLGGPRDHLVESSLSQSDLVHRYLPPLISRATTAEAAAGTASSTSGVSCSLKTSVLWTCTVTV